MKKKDHRVVHCPFCKAALHLKWPVRWKTDIHRCGNPECNRVYEIVKTSTGLTAQKIEKKK